MYIHTVERIGRGCWWTNRSFTIPRRFQCRQTLENGRKIWNVLYLSHCTGSGIMYPSSDLSQTTYKKIKITGQEKRYHIFLSIIEFSQAFQNLLVQVGLPEEGGGEDHQQRSLKKLNCVSLVPFWVDLAGLVLRVERRELRPGEQPAGVLPPGALLAVLG